MPCLGEHLVEPLAAPTNEPQLEIVLEDAVPDGCQNPLDHAEDALDRGARRLRSIVLTAPSISCRSKAREVDDDQTPVGGGIQLGENSDEEDRDDEEEEEEDEE